MIQIHTGKLQYISSSCSQALQDSKHLLTHPLLNASISQDRRYLLTSLIQKQQHYQQLLHHIISYLNQSITAYEVAERDIQEAMGGLSSLSQRQPFWNTNASYMKFQHRFHNSISADKGIMGYINNGVCVGMFVGFHAASFRANKSMRYLTMQGSMDVGKVSVSADAKAVLKQNDKWDPALILQAEASAALAKATATIRLGNDYIHADGEVSGGVGVASAEAKAIINKEEISLKAEAGVAALKGEVKGSFSVFGATITLSGSGEVGSIGGGAEFSSKKGEWELGGKLSFIAGLGFKVKVNYGG